MATTSELAILVSVKDQATQAMQNISGSLKGMESQFKALAGVGTAVLAGVAGVGVKALADAKEAIDGQKQLQAVLKSTGGAAGVTAEQANELANSLAKVTNFQDDTITGAQNMLLTFTRIGKDVFPDATETVLNMSAALGQDLKSSSIQLGKALNDPIAGISALSRVGVSFSDDQQKVIKAFVETGDVASAQKIILKELATEFGGSARALADPLTQLQNSIGEVFESIGKSLIPIVNQLVQTVAPIIQKLQDWIDAHPELTKNIFLAAGAVGVFLVVLGGLGLILPAIISGITLLASPIVLGAIAIAAIIAGVIIFRDRLSELLLVLDGNTGVVTYLKDAWTEVTNVFFYYLMPALQQLWDALQPYKPFLEALAKLIGVIVVGAVYAFITGLKWIIELSTVLIAALASVEAWLATKLLPIFQKAYDFIIKVVNAVESLISALGKLNVVKGAQSIISGVIGGASSLLGLADGGIVTSPTLAMIGEGGEPEAVIPLSKMGSVGGGGMIININGGTYLSQDAAGALGDMILDQLKLNMRI